MNENRKVEQAILLTKSWLINAVIGLNFCPFAKAPHNKGLIHYHVSQSQDTNEILSELERELDNLAKIPAKERETTLFILTDIWQDFWEFNYFAVPKADSLIAKMNLDGILQIAPFHPKFEFDGAGEDNITNATNRAPFPTFHLIREESIDKAVVAFPDASKIYEANQNLLKKLGQKGWEEISEKFKKSE